MWVQPRARLFPGTGEELPAQSGCAGAVGDAAKVAGKKAEAGEIAVAAEDRVRGRSVPVDFSGVAVVVVDGEGITGKIIEIAGSIRRRASRTQADCDVSVHLGIDRPAAGSRVVA